MKAKQAPRFCLLLGLSMAAAVTARECPVEAPRQIPPTVLTGGFFDAHPDLFWRSMAQRAERDRQPARALDYYTRSARYADKFSQATVARLYQEGVGTRADPVMAYIWMDLAAERMYHDFLVLREHYWARLDALQQAQAIERGQQVYADYGDRVAKPRMERALRDGRQQITGSRLGYVSSGLIVVQRRGNEQGIVTPGSIVYDNDYWRAADYWCLQDNYWRPALTPSVEIGRPDTVRDDKAVDD
ncbi:TPA: sel1 repeat family protein [Stenotrophomonas maltophilia]|uniref:sel1 repeat family protein n=1 Tax=Stenotrophomonas maltophilia TaxID=40324 RepID=UPI00066BAAFB|nr:sel1 repeat family protein [Stenotrophomonas maltophilia]ASE53764.1 sel1 repeat family protein [Stenotrophomonas maltophilia]HDX0898144.1 sel1 repeat family protein [Stenotrophomonas maltophilia]HDX0915997.1 sel1 repeat family protein [Stenotrophomonas maltophilia]HEL3013906.1 sel1 repeat family protein [Stenotrophomonas maltophilia]HEL4141445.1 sel1 repeat family protein [Stenotrophomonas maltophilia]